MQITDMQAHADQVFERLQNAYPDAHCELDFRTPYQLLVATIMAAQSTDQQVNRLTERLFADHPTPESMISLTPEELEDYIRGCGLYRNKARHILATSQILIAEYGGEVPRTLDELVRLPGVGRKTANVVLSNAFGLPAFAVDTHVLRVSRRLGLSSGKNPDQVEKDVTALLPPERWKDAHHWLIWHGRRCCHARKPQCEVCPLQDICPAVQKQPS